MGLVFDLKGTAIAETAVSMNVVEICGIMAVKLAR
jgi:hypothetical protein